MTSTPKPVNICRSPYATLPIVILIGPHGADELEEDSELGVLELKELLLELGVFDDGELEEELLLVVTSPAGLLLLELIELGVFEDRELGEELLELVELGVFEL